MLTEFLLSKYGWDGKVFGKGWPMAVAESETKSKASCSRCCGASKNNQRGQLLLEAFAVIPSLVSPLISEEDSHSPTHPALWVRIEELTVLMVFIL